MLQCRQVAEDLDRAVFNKNRHQLVGVVRSHTTARERIEVFGDLGCGYPKHLGNRLE